MKIGLGVSIIAIVSAMIVPSAFGQPSDTEEGTIVDVQKQKVATPAVRTGADSDRTPLQSNYYRYKVSVQLNCEVYIGRYESELDDLPSALASNTLVPVRLKRHVMYLDFPGREVKMQVIHHEARQAGACGQATVGKQ